MKPNLSNKLNFSISKVNITFNNISGLLNSYTQRDLYVMSRRNGSQQTWNEFRGIVKNSGEAANNIGSLGSLIVIDPVRDLSLMDYLSASSLGQFSFQASIQYKDIQGVTSNVAASIDPIGFQEAEIAILTNYAGILIDDKGSSSTMSGLLTKQAVLEAKSSGKSTIDYEEVNAMVGGNFFKSGVSSLGNLYKKKKKDFDNARGNARDVNNKVGDISDKLSKYL